MSNYFFKDLPDLLPHVFVVITDSVFFFPTPGQIHRICLYIFIHKQTLEAPTQQYWLEVEEVML